MDRSIKISKIETINLKGSFGNGKYFGYGKYKVLGLVKVTTNKKISGLGECLVGVYSPELLNINIKYILKFLKNKNLEETLTEIENLQKNKFFFDTGILKSVLSSLEIAIFDILSQINKCTLRDTFKFFFFKNKKVKNFVDIYASAGSIKSNLKDLHTEIKISRKIGIDRFKARLDINNDVFKKKLEILNNETEEFAVDLITNTYEKNQNHKKLRNFLRQVEVYSPLWIEEILNKDQLYLFFKINKKYNLKFSYGENFNSYYDFVNLLSIYKFDYINPDISHLSLRNLVKLINYIKSNNLKKKIILHCWGGSINLFTSLSIAACAPDVIKLVEFPITDFSLNKYFIENASIKNSKFEFDDKIYSNSQTLKNIKNSNIKNKLTFHFN